MTRPSPSSLALSDSARRGRSIAPPPPAATWGALSKVGCDAPEGIVDADMAGKNDPSERACPAAGRARWRCRRLRPLHLRVCRGTQLLLDRPQGLQELPHH